MTYAESAPSLATGAAGLQKPFNPDPNSPVNTFENPAFAYVAKLSTKSSRVTTARTLARVAKFFGGELASFRWQDLRHAHMQAFRSWVADSFSHATANRWISAVRGVLRMAWRMGLMTIEDLERACDIEKVRGTRLLRGRSVAAEELARLFDATGQDRYRKRAARDAAVLAVLYGGGVRRSAVIALDLDSFVRDEAPFVQVVGKGNKERRVYLPEASAEVLTAWIEVRGRHPGPLFVATRPDGSLLPDRMHLDSVRRIVCKLADRSGVKRVSPHDFRRTYIGDLLDAGADIVTVQALAGHADVTTTARYDRRGERTKARAAQLLNLPERRGR